MNSTQSHQPLKVAGTAFGGLLTITLLSAAVLTNTRTYADTVTADDTVTITIESACTFAGDDEGTEHTKTIIPGTVESNIGTTRMTAICNDPAGFDIYAVGYTNNTWKNNTLSYTDSSSNEHTIATGTNTTGNSSWAMKLTGGSVAGNNATIITTPTDYTNYAPVPGGEDGNYTKVATRSSNTTTSSDASLTSTYQVYANSAQTAGTYTGQVKYTLVHPQGTTAPEAEDPSSYYMQDFSMSECQARASAQNIVVYDRRDNNGYTVRYLGSNCWMTQNLRVTHSEGQAEGVILGEDSDFSAESITFSNDLSEGNSYTEARYHVPTDADISTLGGQYTSEQIGNWYNFCAASAEDVTNHGCDRDESYSGSESICPAGWALPTNDQNTDLRNSTRGQVESFSPVSGGYYSGGYLNTGDGFGYWWTLTANNFFTQKAITYNGSLGTGSAMKQYGYNVRCVLVS